MTHHLEVDQFEECRRLEIYRTQSASPSRYRQREGEKFGGGGVVRRTHVRAPDFSAALLEAALDILPLISLVVPQASDEVVERLFEPVSQS